MKPHGSRLSRRGTPQILVTIALLQWLWLGQVSSAGLLHVPSQFPTIQAAISAANTGDAVVLADGTYSGPGNVNVRFLGKAITVRSANGPAACMIDCQQAARGFIFDNDETAASVLRGVTIHHGQAVPDASLLYPNSGGGVYIHWSSPTIEQCILSACSAVGVGGMYLNGSTSIVRDCVFSASTGVSAVAAPDSCCTFDGCSFAQNAGSFALSLFFDLGGCSGPTVITDCSFTSNLGAAIVSMYGSTSIERTTFTANGGLGLNVLHGTHTLTDCVFSDHPGLAMQSQLHESGHITLTNVEFAGNQGGGLSLGLGGTTRLAGCSFNGNSAPNGGGLRVNTSSAPAIFLKECVFAHNTAGSNGGAVHAQGDVVHFANCRFIQNSAAGDGGAIYAQFPNTYPHLRLQNCALIGNSATRGGAIASGAIGSPAILANCTLFHNSASATGGALYSFSGLVTNSILWMNQPDQIFDDFGSATSVSFSNIQGGWSGSGGSNIALDPLFVNAAGADGRPGTEDDDLRLAAGSPSIDAGFNWLVLDDNTDLDSDGDHSELAPIDLAGNARFADDPAAPDTGCGTPVVVDHGAWERTGLTPAFSIQRGDIDGDGQVDVDDLIAVILGWGCADPCCLANVNGNGSVDVDDLVLVILNWDV